MIIEHFQGLTDPRIERCKRHYLLDIVALAICAVVCGADNWVEIAEFGRAKADWLRRFLALPNGIPSHDTLGRVFSRLDPEQFQAGFLEWARSVSQLTQGEVVAIDGKTLRGSGDRGAGLRPLHLVSAWAAANRLTLGQVRTTAHSNEITAIPQLLRLLDLRGCLVTIDAMGCQKSIARQIVVSGADYLLAVKGNQGELYANLQDAFQCAAGTGATAECRAVSKGHGRLEVRQCRVITDREELAYIDPRGEWPQLRSVAQVSYQRQAAAAPPEQRYYLCSRSLTAAAFLQNSRTHWTIENSLHWVLDVAFDEDHNRARTGHAPGNLAVVRQLALNLLRQEKSLKVGVQAKRKRAGWDCDYLQKVLSS